MNKWPLAPVEEIAAKSDNALATGPFGSSIGSSTFRSAGVPLIRGSNLSADVGCRLDDSSHVFIDEELAHKFRRSQVVRGDLVFTCWGTINQIGLIDDRTRYPRYIVSNKQMKLTPDKEKADPLFLYYWFSGPEAQHQILSASIGSSVPGFNLGQLRSMSVPRPALHEQRTIAHILGTLDDKIELNRRMNQTLEGIARAIFKSWFIDFDPVKAKAAGATGFRGMPQDVFDQLPDHLIESDLGPFPAGWKITAISNIAEYVNGKAFTNQANGKGRMIIRIAELNSGPGVSTKYSDVDSEPQYTAFPDDILFAWSGSLGVYRWHRDEAIINQHIFKVIPNDRPKWHVYYRLVEAMEFFLAIASTKATTMGHIKRGHLSEARFVESPKWLIEAADNLIRPLFDLVHINERQALNLAAVREMLLPRLMSGELRASWGQHV